MLRIGKSGNLRLRTVGKDSSSFICISFLLFLIFILLPYVAATWNPYEVIGVRKDASLDQIKKAYRELARKLHPDKSNLNESEAGKKFIELNKAFNILKDPDRRSRYDQYGETEENRHARGHQNHQYHNRHFREQWNQNGYRTFTFFSTSDGLLKKKSITSKQYYADYVQQSKHKPFYIFFYADFCPSCSLIENVWTKITDELKKYNIGSFTINVHQESRLAQELGVSSIPHIACLIDGQVRRYHQSELSLASIVQFTRKSLPNNLITPLDTSSEQDRFIVHAPQHNRLSVLILHNEKSLKLRYILLAFSLRDYYRFGSVSIRYSEYQSLIDKYKLFLDGKSQQTRLLIFDEDVDKPLATYDFKSDDVDIHHIKQQLLEWPFLKLPRISSQWLFDELSLLAIPKVGEKTSPRLCVILFVTDRPSTVQVRRKMLEFISLNQLYRKERVVFGYIDPHKQKNFVSSIQQETQETSPTKDADVALSILLIERHPRDSRKSHYKWLKHSWNPEDSNELDQAKLELYQAIQDYLTNSFSFSHKLVLDQLIDEEGPGFFDRIYIRIADYLARSLYYLTNDMPESVSTIIVLVICALITSFFLYQSPTSPVQSNSPFKQSNDDIYTNGQRQENPSRTIKSNGDLKILELKAETYNGLVRLLKPGFRSIVLLTDRATKDILMPKFEKAVWPYRRNKTLHFGFLCLDKNLDWYRCLLQEVLGVEQLRVNKKNCIGTVLSLNGFKKYVRVYHNKHRENEYEVDEESEESFLGFNSQENSAEEGTIHLSDIERSTSLSETSVENLLTRLPIWLDKMFDGMTKRYFLDNWPEEMN